MCAAASPPGDGSGPLILVVDDDPDLLDLMEEALTAQGYRIARAQNGEEALERLEAEQPRLILLDMRMPVMNGWQFARYFHERHGRKIPIVVITAAEDAELRAKEVGAERALGKPFDLEDLFEVADSTLSR